MFEVKHMVTICMHIVSVIIIQFEHIQAFTVIFLKWREKFGMFLNIFSFLHFTKKPNLKRKTKPQDDVSRKQP